jgi:hypothetical protein
MVHVAALDSLLQGCEVWGRGTCSNTGDRLAWEVRSRAVGHVTKTEPALAGRQGLERQGTW